MKKKNLITMGILGLALILAINYAGCELFVDNTEENKKTVPSFDEDSEPNAFITLNPSTKYQYVRGFGGMDVPWLDGGWELRTISKAEYEKMYDPNGPLGLNIMRIMIMPIKAFHGGTVPDSKYTFTTDPEEFLDFITSAAGKRPDYIEGVKIVNKHGGYVLASPWTPPPTWKANNSIIGGRNEGLLVSRYGDYAAYLRKFAQEMKDRGAPIYAISIQNEPNYSTDKEQYDGCMWSDLNMRNFFTAAGVGNFTGAGTVNGDAFPNPVPGYGGGAATARVLIMNGESANNPNIHAAAMADTTSRGIIDLLARHNYGENNATPYNPGAEYDKEMWMTEMNINTGSAQTYPNDSKWNYVWEFLNDVDVTIRQRKDNAYVWWTLKRFYSFIGDGDFGTTDGAILPRGYALSHYAKFAKEKWQIGVTVSGELANGTTISAATVNHVTVNRQLWNPARVTAFMSDDGKEISVVMYVPTLPTPNENGNNTLIDANGLGTIRIDLPDGFVAKEATAMRSNATAMGQMGSLTVQTDDDDGKSYVTVKLARSDILSVKFTK
jgi:O-glycosyl hydrolase